MLLQPSRDPLAVRDVQAHQFFIAMQQMGHRSFGDHQSTGLQSLMHLGNRAMFPETPGANQGNHIQAKFAVW